MNKIHFQSVLRLLHQHSSGHSLHILITFATLNLDLCPAVSLDLKSRSDVRSVWDENSVLNPKALRRTAALIWAPMSQKRGEASLRTTHANVSARVWRKTKIKGQEDLLGSFDICFETSCKFHSLKVQCVYFSNF